ncbi:MAG: DUF1559 domain-containing protein [Mariniblastus sp.]
MNFKNMMLFALAVSISLSQLFPQTATAQLLGGNKKVSDEFIPNSACAALTMHPNKILKDPKFKWFPSEIVTAWGKKEFGFDPMLLDQITFVVRTPGSTGEIMSGPPQIGAALHFKEMQGLSGNMIGQMEETTLAGKTLFSGKSFGGPSVLVFDESTMLFGEEDFFGDMLKADGKSKIAKLVRSNKVRGEIQAVGNLQVLRPMLAPMLANMPAMLPPPVVKLKQIVDVVNEIEVGISAADKRIKTTLILRTESPEDAKDTADIIKDALEFGLDMGVGLLATQMDFTDPVQEATVEYVQRAGTHYKTGLTPEIDGSDVVFNLKEDIAIVPVLLGAALPAVQQVRSAARRTQGMNNARQMSLALYNYHSAYGKFPAQASYDAKGRPLLSWRVHVLPFMDQQELYDQFHLDEPWDSPHNKKLIKKMPPYLQCAGINYQNDGKTVYLGIAGEGMMFGGKKGRTFADFTDGSSNTAWLVEADASAAVEWTRPVDLEIDPKDPKKHLNGVYPGGFTVSLADGSTRFIGNNIDPEIWMNLLTIDDGNVVDMNDF